MGCCTQLLYGMTRASKNVVKSGLTSDYRLRLTSAFSLHTAQVASSAVPGRRSAALLLHKVRLGDGVKLRTRGSLIRCTVLPIAPDLP